MDDSKIAVYQGNTLNLGGSVHAGAHTLNIVGVDNTGVGTVIFSGQENNIGHLTLGINGTTPGGNTYIGPGQILAVQMQGGSTQVGELVTNSPGAAASSLSLRNGATLTVTGNWKNNSNATYNVTIDQDSKLVIGNGTNHNTGRRESPEQGHTARAGLGRLSFRGEFLGLLMSHLFLHISDLHLIRDMQLLMLARAGMLVVACWHVACAPTSVPHVSPCAGSSRYTS